MLEAAGALLEDGAIVLMHDALGPGTLRSGVEETVGLIAPLAALARGRGLRLDVLSRTDPPDATERDAPEASGTVGRGIKRPALEASV
jgi:hypothetical protein